MASRASIFDTRLTTSARPEPLIPADYRPPRDAFQESKEVHSVWNILSTKGVHFTMGWAARSVKHEIRIGLQVLVGFGLISFPSCTALAQSYLQNRPPGIETEPGSLRLAILQKTAGRLFSAELHNSGSQALILNLGTMVANGSEQYPDRIRLQLTVQNKLLRLEMARPGGIAGRIDPMVVPVPSGATFAVVINLDHYNALGEKGWKLNSSPEHYTLRAEYTGVGVSQRATNPDMLGIALMPFWIGSVQSNVLTFTVK